jgi:hypothetical protein
MILAIAALLLHVPAVPQSTPSNVYSAVSITEGTASTPAAGEPVTGASGATVDPADQPVMVAALEPGRLTPTPVVAATPDPAASAPVVFSSSRAAAAFIAATPALARNREQEERRKRLWLGLSIAQSSAATFDAWTTRRVISSGQGQELNPMLRPFAGNSSLYAAIQVTPLLLDYVSRHMMHSHRGWERRTWWVPQSLGTAMSLASGVHNLGVH